jgi:hypothetical protein
LKPTAVGALRRPRLAAITSAVATVLELAQGDPGVHNLRERLAAWRWRGLRRAVDRLVLGETVLRAGRNSRPLLPMCFPIAFSGKQNIFEWRLST